MKHLLSLFAVVTLTGASCGDPSAPSERSELYMAHCDPRAGTILFQRAGTPGHSAGIEIVVRDVWLDTPTHRVHASAELHSNRREALLGPRGVEVLEFAPAGVWPVNAGCAPPIPGDLPPVCVFWHFESYGEDHMLTPGETSAPVEWIFEDPPGDSFDFQARLWWPHGR